MSAPVPQRVLFLCSGNYYRSRFAEELFNHLAPGMGVAYRADSAGLWPECRTHNPGPMSAHTILALRERGVPMPAVLRSPRDVSEADLQIGPADHVHHGESGGGGERHVDPEGAALTIALKEAEHRPLLASRFPTWVERVEFWHVDDVGDSPPSAALPLIERSVRDLLARLAH